MMFYVTMPCSRLWAFASEPEILPLEQLVFQAGLKRRGRFSKATHSSILAWRIPWTEESGGVQSMGLQELDTTWWLNHHHPRARWGEGHWKSGGSRRYSGEGIRAGTTKHWRLSWDCKEGRVSPIHTREGMLDTKVPVCLRTSSKVTAAGAAWVGCGCWGGDSRRILGCVRPDDAPRTPAFLWVNWGAIAGFGAEESWLIYLSKGSLPAASEKSDSGTQWKVALTASG